MLFSLAFIILYSLKIDPIPTREVRSDKNTGLYSWWMNGNIPLKYIFLIGEFMGVEKFLFNMSLFDLWFSITFVYGI